MLSGIDERRITQRNSIKVKLFQGATTQDIKDYLNSHLKNLFDSIILHIRTINSLITRKVLDGMLSMKRFIKKSSLCHLLPLIFL